VQEGGFRACGGRGHLEVLASDTRAIAQRASSTGTTPTHTPHRPREGGDPAAVDALGVIGASLGAAIGSLVNVFDPDLAVVGGGFGAAAGELLLGPAREAAKREAIAPANESLRVVPAELGAEAGLVGAGLVGFEALVER
jgi:glucokinase